MLLGMYPIGCLQLIVLIVRSLNEMYRNICIRTICSEWQLGITNNDVIPQSGAPLTILLFTHQHHPSTSAIVRKQMSSININNFNISQFQYNTYYV